MTKCSNCGDTKKWYCFAFLAPCMTNPAYPKDCQGHHCNHCDPEYWAAIERERLGLAHDCGIS